MRKKREIPSKTGALALRDKSNHALISDIICLSEVGNGNHQKLVSPSVCLRDDPVHPVDLALAAPEFQPAQKLPDGGFWEQQLQLHSSCAGGCISP